MSQTDNWPQVPVLARLPEVAQLSPTYDAGRIAADFETIRGDRWEQPRIVSGEGVGAYVTDLDWRSLSLRSVGGDPGRTDAGGPGLHDFADTPRLGDTPYLAEILAGIPAPLRAVRLMALGPGARSPYHHDTKYNFPWGVLRLHVPVVTTPGAVLVVGETEYVWQAGTLWYADFTRMHMVRNDDSTTRVHMVIDCQVTRELLDLFPAPFRTEDVRRNAVLAAAEAPLADGSTAPAYEFDLPASFRSFEEPDGAFLTDEVMVPARVAPHEGRMTLFVDGTPTYGLVHLGGGEFRFAGWTRERTIRVGRWQAGGSEVTLSTRVGAVTRSRTVTASVRSDRVGVA